MFEYSNSTPVQRKSPLAKVAGSLLFLAIMLRIFSFLADTGKAFWVCFLAWSVLSIVEDLSPRKREKSQRPESTTQEDASENAELSVWWKVFGPLAVFNFITILLGLWPLGGLGILVWLISWVIYDYFESSRFGRRGLTTLSLR
jgi:hypothetical protein